MCALLVSAPLSYAQPHASPTPAPFIADELGKGAVPLDGPWQFHTGDDPSWSNPNLDDSAWEQLTADKPWGAQSHPSYTGFAWYRRHIAVSPAPGASPDFAVLIPAIDDACEIYWNGRRVGNLGSLPPQLIAYTSVPAQTHGLGPIRTGVLAVRVFKLPLGSNEDGASGGFEGLPILGSPDAIAAAKGNLDFRWLRSQQFSFGLSCLYGLVFVFSFLAWLRNRSQSLLFWTASYALMLFLATPVFGLRLQYPYSWHEAMRLTWVSIREISLWFLFLWLLRVNEVRSVARTLRILAVVGMVAGLLDSALYFLYPSLIGARAFEIADAALTCFYLPQQILPVLLVVITMVRRQRLDSARWIVAVFAFLNSAYYSLGNVVSQGSRFTHWTLINTLDAPILSLNGNSLNVQLILRTLLLLAIIYAVIRYSIENRRHQAALEQEFQNARELQQVLIPESLPEVLGFALTSAYKPALEVGGDFFQIIPLENGETMIVLGDVSGKGLRAAMAVSLIVGLVRALAPLLTDPAKLLTEINDRLAGRLQGGFATAIALRLDAQGNCALACAGHLPPFLNGREVGLPGALPLGVDRHVDYRLTRIQLRESDRLALFTDGLLEARAGSGELYGFARLEALFARTPTAADAAQAAVDFGQDDDITILTLTRLAVGEESRVESTAPILTPA